MAHLEVHQVGPQAVVEDLGRPGHETIGVPPSGAADRAGLRQGNRLVGNPSGSAAIEVLLGGLEVETVGPAVMTVTGAPCPVWVDEVAAALGSPLILRGGQRLRLGRPVCGLRSYLAVRGGFRPPQAQRHFGSFSTDPTSRLGPEPLRAGSRIQIGAAHGRPAYGVEIPATRGVDNGLDVGAILGPRDALLARESRHDLGHAVWEVTQDVDRVGLRLAGPILALRDDATLPSEPVIRGAVQVPPSGRPVIFLADHPTTGGYPIVAVVDDADTDRLAQLRPGDRLRIHPRRTPWSIGRTADQT